MERAFIFLLVAVFVVGLTIGLVVNFTGVYDTCVEEAKESFSILVDDYYFETYGFTLDSLLNNTE